MKKSTGKFMPFLVIVISLGLFLNGCGNKNTIENFKQQFSKGNISRSAAIYNQLEESDKKASIEFANAQIDQAYNDFVTEKTTYEFSKRILEGAVGLKEVADKANENLMKLTALDTSRKAFTEAQKLQDSKNYTQAIIEYSKVVKDDKNYDAAQNKIKEVNKLLEDSQEVIISGDVTVGTDSIGSKQANLVFVNKSKKVVKCIYLDILAYDSNGYPVKVNFGYDKIYMAKAEINIQPSATSRECTWTIYSDNSTKHLLACIKKVDYYDGSSWENTLYQAWYNQYYDKPIKI